MELNTAKSTDTTDKNVEITSRSEEESLLNDRARAAATEINVQSAEESSLQKLLKRKWWRFCLILVFVIGVTFVGLSFHFAKETTAPTESMHQLRHTSTISTNYTTRTNSTTSTNCTTSTNSTNYARQASTAPLHQLRHTSTNCINSSNCATPAAPKALSPIWFEPRLPSRTSKQSVTKDAFLMLHQRWNGNWNDNFTELISVDIKNESFSANWTTRFSDDDMKFEFEPNTEIYGACAASLHGEMLILGGKNNPRQVNV